MLHLRILVYVGFGLSVLLVFVIWGVFRSNMDGLRVWDLELESIEASGEAQRLREAANFPSWKEVLVSLFTFM